LVRGKKLCFVGLKKSVAKYGSLPGRPGNCQLRQQYYIASRFKGSSQESIGGEGSSTHRRQTPRNLWGEGHSKGERKIMRDKHLYHFVRGLA